MPKKILYKKEPLARAEYNPEVLREIKSKKDDASKNNMSKDDVAKARAALKPKIEETKESWKEARMGWKDFIESLIQSRTLFEEEQGKILVSWFSGQRFSDVESIKACFGEHLELLRRVGSRYVADADIWELTGIIRRIRERYRVERVARKFLQLEGEDSNGGRIIVGRKPGRNYVLAAVHEVCRNGSVTIQGRNIGKVKAIAESCTLAWPELKQLGTQNGSEQVNGRELKNVEIQLGV